MPTTSRPQKPMMLMFYGKNIVARAFAPSFKLSAAEKADGTPGDPQVAVTFRIGKDQRATYYALPKGGIPGIPGVREGDFAQIPEGTEITLIASLSPNAAPYTVEKLRNAGWTGTSFAALLAGQYDGLGEVDCNITVDVEETDNRNGDWLMRDGDNGVKLFNPRMRINFVNKMGGGFNFKKEATADDAKALDQKLAAILAAADPRALAPAKAAGASNPTGSSASTGGNVPAGDDDIPF